MSSNRTFQGIDFQFYRAADYFTAGTDAQEVFDTFERTTGHTLDHSRTQPYILDSEGRVIGQAFRRFSFHSGSGDLVPSGATGIYED